MSMNTETRDIIMTRGDTERIRVTLRMDGDVYEMQTGDEIHFGVKRNFNDADCLIRKTYTQNPFILDIEPDDTEGLDFGTYRYDMEFVAANGYTVTFAKKKRLKLTEEVCTPVEEVTNDG